jgi:hypothetical protein
MDGGSNDTGVILVQALTALRLVMYRCIRVQVCSRRYKLVGRGCPIPSLGVVCVRMLCVLIVWSCVVLFGRFVRCTCLKRPVLPFYSLKGSSGEGKKGITIRVTVSRCLHSSCSLLTIQNRAQVHRKSTSDLVPFSPRRVLPRFVNPRIGSKLQGFSI